MNWYIEVLKKYSEFNGRARRQEYWMFTLVSTIITFVLMFLEYLISVPFLNSIYSLGVLLPSIAVGVRRLHDINKSGWFLLIPIYNIILLATSGDSGANSYGEDPKGGSSFDNNALDSHLVN
ncbi:MAG: DUF805 domain-containing protein [Cytophagales bacterium]|nr:MAG: DUF805 domain-containing protein [Cytophagales bacterium]